MCADHGVIPQKYLSDNGLAFSSKEFSTHLQKFRQIIRFAGVGAHHHNGCAERAIQMIMSISRTMMPHTAIHWPDVSDSSLWPMAVTHAVYIWNHVPNTETGISPSNLFTKTCWPSSRFHDIHVWGCPTYVLDKTISDGKKIPRWKPQSQRMINMGHSPKHASTVPILLNTNTGTITPQFHVVFDDWFSTITADHDQLPDFNSLEWLEMSGQSSFQYIPLDEDNIDRPFYHAVKTLDTQEAQERSNQVEHALNPCPMPLQVPSPAQPQHNMKTQLSPVEAQRERTINESNLLPNKEPST